MPVPSCRFELGHGEKYVFWDIILRLPTPSAALLNATQVHYQKFDCLQEGAVHMR